MNTIGTTAPCDRTKVHYLPMTQQELAISLMMGSDTNCRERQQEQQFTLDINFDPFGSGLEGSANQSHLDSSTGNGSSPYISDTDDGNTRNSLRNGDSKSADQFLFLRDDPLRDDQLSLLLSGSDGELPSSTETTPQRSRRRRCNSLDINSPSFGNNSMANPSFANNSMVSMCREINH